MKNLNKLHINQERLLRNNDLKMVKGGVDNVYCYGCYQSDGGTWLGCVCVEGDVYDGYVACKSCWSETTFVEGGAGFGNPTNCILFLY